MPGCQKLGKSRGKPKAAGETTANIPGSQESWNVPTKLELTPIFCDEDLMNSLSRRDAIGRGLLAGGAALLAGGVQAQPNAVAVNPGPGPKRYRMKKSINLWAFPYPQKMNLKQCLQLAKEAGFDGIELNYNLDDDLSPKAGPREFAAIRKMADDIGIAISGLCSFLFWPYPLTSNDPEKRNRGLELAGKMAEAAHHLGVENLLVV